MAVVISVVNSKGGVGKTTNAINLAAAFHHEGQKTILIDHDFVQRSASDWKAATEEAGKSVFPVVEVKSDLGRVVEDFSEIYDVIVIDGPGRVENATATLVSISDLVLIPIQPSSLDLWACKKAVEWIQERRIITGGKPEARFMLSRVNPSSNRGDQVAENEDLVEAGIEIMSARTAQRQDYERTLGQGSTVFDLRASNKARLEITAIHEEIKHVLRQD